MEIPFNGLTFEEFIKNQCGSTLFGCLQVSSFHNPAGGDVILHLLSMNKFF